MFGQPRFHPFDRALPQISITTIQDPGRFCYKHDFDTTCSGQ